MRPTFTFKTFILNTILIISSFYTFSQSPKHKIAIFTPLYIDTAFDGNQFKIQGNYLPKIMLPGLEFYNGVMMAIDSLKKAAVSNIEINIYDLKSSKQNIESILNSEEFNGTKIILASLNNREDAKTLANYAQKKQIPFISATFPNDAGISNNPYFFLVNSTLRTHCKSMLSYIRNEYSKSNIVFISRSGSLEKVVQEYINDANKKTETPLKIGYKELTDSFTINQVKQLLDSTKNNVIIGGTTNENFVYRLIYSSQNFKNYKIKIIGLPTWDGLKIAENLNRKNIEIIYTSAYNFDKKQAFIQTLSAKYKNKFDSYPSDMFLKGYENMLKFGLLVSKFENDSLLENINNPNFKVFNDVKFIPSKLDNNATSIDYFENVFLYFLKK